MRILFIGDIIGKPGRKALKPIVPKLREELGLDLVIANGENSATGVGITGPCARDFYDAGVDIITGGNHIWDKPEGISVVDEDPRIVRPINYPPGTPGRGIGVYDVAGEQVVVINALGRIFMNPIDCPFLALDEAIDSLDPQVRIIIVDFHAEATAEKIGMGWYLDGRVSGVFGTHTHVQTADERILPQGTAYLTDAGMTGPRDSVIGVRKELALRRMTTGMPVRFLSAERDVQLCGVWVEVDPESGRATHIERVQRDLVEE